MHATKPPRKWLDMEERDCLVAAIRGIEDSAIVYVQGAYTRKSREAPEVDLCPMLILVPPDLTQTTTLAGAPRRSFSVRQTCGGTPSAQRRTPKPPSGGEATGLHRRGMGQGPQSA